MNLSLLPHLLSLFPEFPPQSSTVGVDHRRHRTCESRGLSRKQSAHTQRRQKAEGRRETEVCNVCLHLYKLYRLYLLWICDCLGPWPILIRYYLLIIMLLTYYLVLVTDVHSSLIRWYRIDIWTNLVLNDLVFELIIYYSLIVKKKRNIC